jgi:Domain of unknown function (DUF4270)
MFMTKLKKMLDSATRLTSFITCLFAFAAIVSILFLTNCTKPTSFGSELLNGDLAEYIYTDTLTVQCTTLLEDSVRTSDVNSTASYFLCGNIKDPIFGAAKSDIYTLFELSQFNPDFKNLDNSPATFDSIVMYLQLKSEGIYGDTMQDQTISIKKLNPDNQIRWDRSYYSTDKYEADEEIGVVTTKIRPSKSDSLVFFNDTTRTVARGTGIIRIPLSEAFGRSIMEHPDSDSLAYQSDTIFWQKFRGLKISTTTADPRAMLAFNLNNTPLNRITLYYHLDGKARYFNFYFTGGNKFTHFTHDYTGSEVASHLNKPNDDLMFLQGMAGLKVKLDIPNAKNLGKVLINKADLELTAVNLPADNINWYAPAKQLLLRDTSKDFTSDVYYSAGSLVNQNSNFNLFGGKPKKETINGQNIQKYNLLLTQRLQEMIDQGAGDLEGTTVTLNVFPQYITAMRSVLYGQSNGSFPAKIKVKYTKIQ